MYLPVNNKTHQFLLVLIFGNHTIDSDPNIIINKNYTIKKTTYYDNERKRYIK